MDLSHLTLAEATIINGYNPGEGFALQGQGSRVEGLWAFFRGLRVLEAGNAAGEAASLRAR